MRDFFRCAARLVVTIYDLLLASILGIYGSDASVAYPFTYSHHLAMPQLTVFASMIAQSVSQVSAYHFAYPRNRPKVGS